MHAHTYAIAAPPSPAVHATVVGGRVDITCSAAGSQDLNISWSKDSADIVTGNRVSISVMNSSGAINSTLTITDAVLGDAGMYTCMVPPSGGGPSTSEFEVIVVRKSILYIYVTR